MSIELVTFRQKKFNEWWDKEIEPKTEGLLNEFKEKVERHKKGFLKFYIDHDAFDDFLIERVSVEKLKKEFEDWFNNDGKPFLESILKSYKRISKSI